MSLYQAFVEALESLAANKLRSGLTILGIVIGVAAVIAMVSVGRGAQSTITGSIQGIGTNLLFVFRNRSDNVRNPKPLTLEDAQALGDSFAAPSVIGVAPILQATGLITFEGQKETTTIEGITPDFATVRNYKVTEGEFITEENMLGKSPVVLLGPYTANTLFGRTSGVVGETVRIENQPFRVA